MALSLLKAADGDNITSRIPVRHSKDPRFSDKATFHRGGWTRKGLTSPRSPMLVRLTKNAWAGKHGRYNELIVYDFPQATNRMLMELEAEGSGRPCMMVQLEFWAWY
ncbi:hypothetical protein LTR36_004653 [Oleoguttula mirabilis]|uniref:Uncharacterized protein n=1 Tax=Oleoguttula mirabilis TaxID=1507867 RepID=A0AAV9JEX8_9PEZI|nr:hypothetical protein LTR36_004653 [Oleoguttula mirabilis]